jgi:hypothetical protein
MPGQSDGMAFVIQTAGPTAIGSTGGSIGYGAPAGQPTAPRIQPSVDIEFDTWDNSPDGYDPAGHTHVAVTTNGNNETALVWADPGFPLIDQAFNAWIDYAASAKTIRIYLSQGTYQPANPLVTANVSLAAVLGTGAAYVGFTAGTGVATGTQFVQTWHLTS